VLEDESTRAEIKGPNQRRPTIGSWNSRWPWLVLLVAGVGWGVSFSLAKIAAIGGAHPLGIVFWQCTVGAVLMIAFNLSRSPTIAINRQLIWLCSFCGLLGLVIPNTAFYNGTGSSRYRYFPRLIPGVGVRWEVTKAFPHGQEPFLMLESTTR
jgi:EamA-like transporter family